MFELIELNVRHPRVSTLARYAGVSQQAIRRCIERGTLAAFADAEGKLRVFEEAAFEYLRRRGQRVRGGIR